jgi:hypothetical protein
MSNALTLTGDDLVRALTAATSATVDGAVRRRAEDVARAVEAETGVAARAIRCGAGDYAVGLEGQGLFAREFGSVDTPAEPVIANAIGRVGR